MQRAGNRSIGETNTRPDERTLLEEVKRGNLASGQASERYSFQIYTDQKKRLRRLRFHLEEQTGQKMSASRIIREALEPYLQKLEDELLES